LGLTDDMRDTGETDLLDDIGVEVRSGLPQHRGRSGFLWRSATFAVRYIAVIVFLAVAVKVTVDPPYRNSPAIRSDGLGYQVWTEALLQGNLSFCPYKEVASFAISPQEPTTHRCANKYPPGLAILRFPLMAPFTAIAKGGITSRASLTSPAQNDVDEAYSLLAGGVVVAAIVIGSRRLGVKTWIANLSALAIGFGTGVFHYTTYDSSFTMIYSAALVALLMLFGISRFMVRAGRPTTRVSTIADMLFLFLVAAFLVDIRLPSFLVLAVLVIAAGVLLWSTGPDQFRRWGLTMSGSIGPALLLVVISQFVYNKYTLGRWTFNSYQSEHFILTQWKEFPVLAGFKKGFLTWYPVAAVTFLAAAIAKQWRALLLLVGLTIPLVILYGSWHSWFLAGGFGHRGFVEIMPVFGVVLAYSIEKLRVAGRVLIISLTGVGTAMCLGLMVAYWQGAISYYSLTQTQWYRYALGTKSFGDDVVHWLHSLGL
jgi:hypothetical protein